MSLHKIFHILPAIIGLILVSTSCNPEEENTQTTLTGKERNLPAHITYSYQCLEKDSGSLSGILGKADDIIGTVATFNIEVTDQEQVAFGEQFFCAATGVPHLKRSLPSTLRHS